jgi:hypothetical protein
MDMTPVESSQIHSVGYDQATQTLAVRFHGKKKPDGSREDGQLYHYDGVPPEKHGELMAAKSKGSHFAVHIKGLHKYTRIHEGKHT